jgi:hypothetical protein
VDRPDHDRVRLPGKLHVVVEPALAANEASVLESPDRLPDAERSHPRLPGGWIVSGQHGGAAFHGRRASPAG